MTRRSSFVLVLLLVLEHAWGTPSRAADFDPKTASMDDLVARVSRNGNTEERRAAKDQARQEIYARKEVAFRYLMERVHLDNVGLQVLAQEMIDQMTADEAAPVLLDFVHAENPDTQRIAVFFLGFYPTASSNAPVIVPCLDVDKVRNAAIRTLGKWQYTNATLEIAAFLKDPKERTRIAAANALRDLGDPRGIAPLVDALADPVFTVRNTAQRSLQTFGTRAEPALLAALPDAKVPALRAILDLLDPLKSRKAYKPLKALLGHPDPYVREAAAKALAGIKPGLMDRLF